MLSVLSDARTFLRYAGALHRFLVTGEDAGACREAVRARLLRREVSFLDVVRRGVFETPGSPYRDLMDWAGVEQGDVIRLVDQEGLDGALSRLHDSGVYVTVDEFKGRTPLRRGSRERTVSPTDFDNPLARRHASGRSGGSGGQQRRIVMDLDMIAHDAAAEELFLDAFQLQGRPFGAWRIAPPGFSGIKKFITYARFRRSADRWFTQNDGSWRGEGIHAALFTRFTLLVVRCRGSLYIENVEAPASVGASGEA